MSADGVSRLIHFVDTRLARLSQHEAALLVAEFRVDQRLARQFTNDAAEAHG